MTNKPMVKYECVRDLQGGDFGVGFIGTIEEWRDNALTWADCDGNEGVFEMLTEMPTDLVIDFIQDFWELEIERVD